MVVSLYNEDQLLRFNRYLFPSGNCTGGKLFIDLKFE